MSEEKSKRKIYIVGGKGKNVPPWISSAFEVEQFEQDHTRGREPDPSSAPDAVVVLSSWVGHKHFYDARTLAEELSIPLILSPGGWSASLKSAADLGVEWFIKDIETYKSSKKPDEAATTEIEEFIDNAWREAYNREWTAREALEKRFAKQRLRLEEAEAELKELREKEAAAQRVISEIRSAASAQRKSLDLLQKETERRAQEVQDRSHRISQALAGHLSAMSDLLTSTGDAHDFLISAANRLGDARSLAKQKIDTLYAALTVAEAGDSPEVNSEVQEDRTGEEESTVRASNLDVES